MSCAYSNNDAYKINYSKPGTVVIINNKHFKDGRNRLGSENDVEKLDLVLKKLNFMVEIHQDQTATEIRDLVKMYAGRDHTAASCFIFFLMSHGIRHKNGKSYIIGIDLKNVDTAELINILTFSKTLINKPKLFFTQACRGNAKMKTISISKPNGSGSDKRSQKLEKEINEKIVQNNLVEHNTDGDYGLDISKSADNHIHESSSLNESNKIRISNESDFLIAYSTIVGYRAFRDINFGSWYIQELCNVLSRTDYKEYHLLELLTFVNNSLEKKSQDSKIFMVPTIDNRLKKFFYFYQEVSFLI